MNRKVWELQQKYAETDSQFSFVGFARDRLPMVSTLDASGGLAPVRRGYAARL
jgi:hypothetical protein